MQVSNGWDMMPLCSEMHGAWLVLWLNVCVQQLCAQQLCVQQLCVQQLCAQQLCVQQLCAQQLCVQQGCFVWQCFVLLDELLTSLSRHALGCHACH